MMEIENDPNIIYGGDTSDLGPIDGGYGSLGGLLFADLKLGENRTASVCTLILMLSINHNKCYLLDQWNFQPNLDVF